MHRSGDCGFYDITGGSIVPRLRGIPVLGPMGLRLGLLGIRRDWRTSVPILGRMLVDNKPVIIFF